MQPPPPSESYRFSQDRALQACCRNSCCPTHYRAFSFSRAPHPGCRWAPNTTWQNPALVQRTVCRSACAPPWATTKWVLLPDATGSQHWTWAYSFFSPSSTFPGTFSVFSCRHIYRNDNGTLRKTNHVHGQKNNRFLPYLLQRQTKLNMQLIIVLNGKWSGSCILIQTGTFLCTFYLTFTLP